MGQCCFLQRYPPGSSSASCRAGSESCPGCSQCAQLPSSSGSGLTCLAVPPAQLPRFCLHSHFWSWRKILVVRGSTRCGAQGWVLRQIDFSVFCHHCGCGWMEMLEDCCLSRFNLTASLLKGCQEALPNSVSSPWDFPPFFMPPALLSISLPVSLCPQSHIGLLRCRGHPGSTFLKRKQSLRADCHSLLLVGMREHSYSSQVLLFS